MMSDTNSNASVSSARTRVTNRKKQVDKLPGVEAYLRRRGSTNQIFAPSDLNNLEQYVNKRRRSSVGLLQLGEKENIFRESSSKSLGRRQSSGSFWEQTDGQKVQEEYTPKKKTKARHNLLDKKSLYSITQENIAGKDMQFRDKPTIGDRFISTNNIEQKLEREYILKTHLRENNQTKFENVIMRHFYKAPTPKTHPGYGMPRPDTREDIVEMSDTQEGPSLIKVNSYPSLSNPQKCQKGHDFCEVLGPASCSTCIETTNRYISDELQRIMHPTIDMNRDKLIKPKLSKVMKNGHMFQVRKKNMDDLDYPEEFAMSLRRQETQLSQLTKSAVARLMTSRSGYKKRSSHTRRKAVSGILPRSLKPLE
ncbi:uncharacterized protein LOC134686225 isoform X1 [Mytilus trossulus]|uniref:uncharacterized protein LOC134686225 isoform X1 n=2 Tax=Mytilus trossulus TaxID=6551 RepID=UPI003007CEA5